MAWKTEDIYHLSKSSPTSDLKDHWKHILFYNNPQAMENSKLKIRANRALLLKDLLLSF